MPRKRPVGGSYGGSVTQTAAPSAGASRTPDEGETLGDGRVGRHDDGLGGHQTTGGVGVVRQEHAHVVGLFGLHEFEQGLAARLGSCAMRSAASSGCIWSRTSAARSSSSCADQVDLVLSGISSSTSARRPSGSSSATSLRRSCWEVEQGGREVGGQEVGVGGDQLLGRLRLALRGLLAHRSPIREERRALAEGRGSGARTPEEEVADCPFAGPDLFDRHVFDDRLTASIAQHDSAPEELGDDADLATALLEAAQVDLPGRDDLAGADARDAADGEEDAALSGDLDDESDDRRALLRAVDDEHVAHLADLVASGVEDGAPGQSGDEDSRGAHV